MKKIMLLIPTILTPLSMSLYVSCAQASILDNIQFDITHTEMFNEKHATIDVTWNPSNLTLDLTNSIFTYDNDSKPGQVTIATSEAGHTQLEVAFLEDITTSNIVDGKLEFYYSNKDTPEEARCAKFSNITIEKFTPEPLHPNNFYNCDWSILINACTNLESGTINEEEFCDLFYVDKDLSTPEIEPINATSFADIIGQRRLLNLNSQEHNLIVLDFNHDTIDGSSTKAAITFQFGNLVSTKDGYCYSCIFDEKDAWNYWSSALCKVLNSEDDVTWASHPEEKRSVFKMIKTDNDALASNIKSVTRSVCEWHTQESTGYELVTKPTKLFEPNIADLYSENGINDDSSIINSEGRPLYCQEGTQYSYYKQHIKDDPVLWYDAKTYDSLVRGATKHGSFRYWLSSSTHITPAKLEYSTLTKGTPSNGGNIFLVKEEGGLYGEEVGSACYGAVAPCFCI